MSFKNYIEEIVVTLPRPTRRKITINIQEYKTLVENSKLKSDRKELIRRLIDGKEIPIFCEETKRFFMTPTKGKKLKAREVKSRGDKQVCGTLLNAMMVHENAQGNYENLDILFNMPTAWEIPSQVYKI